VTADILSRCVLAAISLSLLVATVARWVSYRAGECARNADAERIVELERRNAELEAQLAARRNP